MPTFKGADLMRIHIKFFEICDARPIYMDPYVTLVV